MEKHLLIVTKNFRKQDEPLNYYDFLATYQVLLSNEGIVFYNNGSDSGTTQLHKHLQAILIQNSKAFY